MGRRALYGGALAAAVLFQIFYRGWLGTFTLVLVIAVPFFSLALSLPGLLCCALKLPPETPTVFRGQEGAFLVRLDAPFPVGRVSFRLTFSNRLTGDALSARRVLSGGCRAARREDVTARHCGQVRCTADQVRVWDLSGLFSFPLRRVEAGALLSLPLPADTELPPEVLGGRHDGAGFKPRPGGGPGEDYDLRPYRPGDPMRSVHWKLSSKLDDLVVRETLEPRRSALVLTYDHFGPGGALDRTLDKLCTLSRLLLQRERPHHIQWADPVSGAVRDCPISSERELLDCLSVLLATPAPAEGRSILDIPLKVPGADGPVRHLHVSAGPGEEAIP